MNCYYFKKSVNDLIEGNIDGELKSEMEMHMDACSLCKKEYEETRDIVDSLRKDASSIVISDRQRKEIKGEVLSAPIRKHRGFQSMLKSLTYAAAIFMFITAGIYFTGGVNINIGPVQGQDNSMQLQIDKLEGDNRQLTSKVEQLESRNMDLEAYIKELESGRNKHWMMINPNISEAIIEGRIVSIDSDGGKIRLNIYKDDNTPDIDPNIIIPDGIMISRVPQGAGESFKTMVSGSIKDFKQGDHITVHYIESLKAARAAILYEKGL